jgi:signal transduction histidine kinase
VNLLEKVNWAISPVDRTRDYPERIKSFNLLFNLGFQFVLMSIMLPIYHFFLILTQVGLLFLSFGIISSFCGLIIYYKKGYWPGLAHLIMFNSLIVVVGGAYFSFNNSIPALLWCHITFVFAFLYLNKRAIAIWALAYLIGVGLLRIGLPSEAMINPQLLHLTTFINFSLALFVLFSQIYIYFKLRENLFEKLEQTEYSLRDKLEENKKLIRIVTHDIANPLTVIEFVSKKITAPNADLETFKEKLLRSNKTIKEILNDVRNLQTIIDGIKQINLAPSSIDYLITETIKRFEDRLTEKNIQVIYNESHLEANVDANILRNEVLCNLLSNAIKFTYPNGRIEITAEQIEHKVIIRVLDHGMGIKPDIVPKLFLVTQKISTIGTSGEKGTGYGLPICKSILELMGGSISVQSKHVDESPTDHGTVFSISLIASKMAG